MLAREGLAALGFAALVAGCSSELASPPEPSPTPVVQTPAPVHVVRPEPVAGPEEFASSLYVERDVWLTARASGIVQQVLVDRGQHVREAQSLVVIETDLAEGELRIAEQRLRLAEAEFERTRALHAQRVVSAQDALRREIERDLAESEVALARARLDRCHVRAPFEGTIVERLVVSGQRIVEEDSTPLLRLVAADELLVRVEVPEARLATLVLGGAARVAVDDPAPAEHAARIVFVSPVIDAGSGTGSVVARVRSHGQVLRPGAAVRVRFEGAASAAGERFRIPRDALVGGPAVLAGRATVLVAAGGRAEARTVEVVEVSGHEATVRGDISARDLVIVGGRPGIAAGDAVEVLRAAR